LLLIPLLLGLRATWPFAISALGLVALLSTQAHKEERFIIAFWPFALIGAGGAVGGWLAIAQARWGRSAPGPRWFTRTRLLHIGVAAAVALVLIDDFRRPITGDL